jgi:hypothetical protein
MTSTASSVRTSTATSSATSTATGMATATTSSSFYGNRQFINVRDTANILLSRVETPSAANAAILNRV